MEYRYIYKNTVMDMFILDMISIYTSMIGVINIIFIFAASALLYARFAELGLLFCSIVIFALLLFVCFHPFAIYQKSKRTVQGMKEVDIRFLKDGITVLVDSKMERLPWKSIRGVQKKFSTIVIYTDERHGYILNKRILKKDFDTIYRYVKEHI